jgi:hypothetical protein
MVCLYCTRQRTYVFTQRGIAIIRSLHWFLLDQWYRGERYQLFHENPGETGHWSINSAECQHVQHNQDSQDPQIITLVLGIVIPLSSFKLTLPLFHIFLLVGQSVTVSSYHLLFRERGLEAYTQSVNRGQTSYSSSFHMYSVGVSKWFLVVSSFSLIGSHS